MHSLNFPEDFGQPHSKLLEPRYVIDKYVNIKSDIKYLCYTYNGLSENVPHRHRCLNSWLPVGGTVCVGLGGTVLMEEVCHWGQTFSFQPHLLFPAYFLSFLFVV